MNNLIVKNDNEITFSDEQKELIKSQIAVGCSDDELKLFMHVASKSGLDPFSRQIYAIKRKVKINGQYTEKMAIQTGIDGFRLVAHRTGQCLSISDPEFNYKGKNLIPFSAKVIVKKIVGQHIGEFTATAYWSDYYGDGRSYIANQKPRIMLGKCAESLALRKAFPVELSGIHTQEEMVIADIEEIKTTKQIEKIEEQKNDSIENKNKTIEAITTIIKSAWEGLDDNKRIFLMNDILKVKKINDLITNSEKELKDKFNKVNNFIDQKGV